MRYKEIRFNVNIESKGWREEDGGAAYTYDVSWSLIHPQERLMCKDIMKETRTIKSSALYLQEDFQVDFFLNQVWDNLKHEVKYRIQKQIMSYTEIDEAFSDSDICLKNGSLIVDGEGENCIITFADLYITPIIDGVKYGSEGLGTYGVIHYTEEGRRFTDFVDVGMFDDFDEYRIAS